jgi:hypothetical protein
MIKCPECDYSLVLKSPVRLPDNGSGITYRTKIVCTYNPSWEPVTEEHYCGHRTERDPAQDVCPEIPRDRVEHYDLCGNEVTE